MKNVYPLINRGITLIELVIAISISAIALGLIAGSWSLLMRGMEQSKQRTNLSSNNRLLSVILKKKIEGATVLSLNASELIFIGSSADTHTMRVDNTWIIDNADTIAACRSIDTLHDFRFAYENEYVSSEDDYVILQCTWLQADRFGNRSPGSVTARVKQSKEKFGW